MFGSSQAKNVICCFLISLSFTHFHVAVFGRTRDILHGQNDVLHDNFTVLRA